MIGLDCLSYLRHVQIRSANQDDYMEAFLRRFRAFMYDWGDHNCLDRIKAYTQPGFHKIIWIICIQSFPPKKFFKKLKKWRWSRRIHENLVCSMCSHSGEWRQLRDQKKKLRRKRGRTKEERRKFKPYHTPRCFFCLYPFAQSPRLHADISYLKQVTPVTRLLCP